MNTLLSKLVVLFVCLQLGYGFLPQQEFDILTRYGSNEGISEWTKVGVLNIPKSSYESPQITLKHDSLLINPALFKDKKHSFATIKLQEKKNGERQWLTYVDAFAVSKFQMPYQETIQLVVSSQNQLNSFDYALQQLRTKNTLDDAILVKYSVQQEAPIEQTAHEQEKPKDAQEEQAGGIFGLVMKYKWWIVIFLIVFVVAGNMDPQSLNETVQQAQSQAAASSQKRAPRKH